MRFDRNRIPSYEPLAMTCPICNKPGVTAGHILAHGGKGKAKTLTTEQRAFRRTQANTLNAKRRAAKDTTS